MSYGSPAMLLNTLNDSCKEHASFCCKISLRTWQSQTIQAGPLRQLGAACCLGLRSDNVMIAKPQLIWRVTWLTRNRIAWPNRLQTVYVLPSCC